MTRNFLTRTSHLMSKPQALLLPAEVRCLLLDMAAALDQIERVTGIKGVVPHGDIETTASRSEAI